MRALKSQAKKIFEAKVKLSENPLQQYNFPHYNNNNSPLYSTALTFVKKDISS